MIADAPAVSACQALPEAEVARIFGAPGPRSYIWEDYYVASASASEVQSASFPRTTSCRYEMGDEENTVVSVDFERYPSEAEARASWQETATADIDEAKRLLAEFKKSIPGAGAKYNLDEKQLQGMAAAMEQAIAGVSDFEKAEELDGSGILYVPNLNGFLAIAGQDVIKLSTEFGGSDFFDQERKVDRQEVAAVTSNVKAAFDVIFANLKKPNLSQEPSSVVRGQSATSIGTTKILDPCMVLDESIAKTALTTEALSPMVEVMTVQKDFARPTGKNPPNNSCLRRASGTGSYVQLELSQSPNEDIAAAFYKSSLKSSKPITTTATQAAFIDQDNGDDVLQFVRFQQGPYVGTLTMVKVDFDRRPVRVPQEVFSAATDGVVANITAQQ